VGFLWLLGCEKHNCTTGNPIHSRFFWRRYWVLEEGFKCPNEDGESREDEELGSGILNTEFGEERIFLRDDDIYRGSDEQGRGEVEDFVEDGIEGCQDHCAAMRGGVVPEAGEGVGFVHGGIVTAISKNLTTKSTKFTKIKREKL